MGRKMMTEHDNIVAQAFNEESADIPNATPRKDMEPPVEKRNIHRANPSPHNP